MSRLISAVLVLALIGGSASAKGADPVFGLWRNPKNTVHVRTEPCEAGLCGKIVQASEKAQADARRKGVDTLLGLQLFRNYSRDGDGWSGRLYLPDQGRTVSSTIALVGPDQLRISGCIVAGMFCKSQLWTRIE